MKKLILSLAFVSSLAFAAQSQGLYVGAGFGYGGRAGSTIIGTRQTPSGTDEVVKGSYGKGIVPNLSVGFLFPNNLGAEVTFGYLIGTKTIVKDEYAGNAGPDQTGSDEHSAKSFYINPS